MGSWAKCWIVFFLKGHLPIFSYIYIYSIEVIRSPTTSTEMTSKRKVRNPEITIKPIVRRKIQPNKHSIGRIHECRSKAKTLINTLQGEQTSKDEIFELLELNHTDSESSNSDNEIFQINQSSSSRESSNISSSPDIRIGCKDSIYIYI